MGSSAPSLLQLNMKFLTVFAGLSLAGAKPQFGKDLGLTEGRIIGGEEAPKHEFPWQVSLKSLGSHICGGSIVNRNQVITAAHCCEGQVALFDKIVAGAHDRNLEPGHQSRGISSMEFHESWNDPAFDHDICLVTVNEPFDFKDPNVQPIDFFKTADAQIPLHSAADCETIFPGYITENMVCAGSAGHATCNGDSGGPLVCPGADGVGKLTGIVSFGYTGCTNAGVYAKVSQFEDWIMERWVD